MDLMIGKVTVFLSLLLYVLIRWPHGRRYDELKIAENRHGHLETVLLTGATLGTTLLPILWITTGLFDFAEYPLHPVPYFIGVAMALFGLWLFYRSHADLGLNWSATLKMREDHKLVTAGIYSRIRHPMYAAMLILGFAQVLFLPNWLIGPTYLVSFGLLYMFRYKVEERMMLDHFGADYEAYMQETGAVIPKLYGTQQNPPERDGP